MFRVTITKNDRPKTYSPVDYIGYNLVRLGFIIKVVGISTPKFIDNADYDSISIEKIK